MPECGWYACSVHRAGGVSNDCTFTVDSVAALSGLTDVNLTGGPFDDLFDVNTSDGTDAFHVDGGPGSDTIDLSDVAGDLSHDGATVYFESIEVITFTSVERIVGAPFIPGPHTALVLLVGILWASRRRLPPA